MERRPSGIILAGLSCPPLVRKESLQPYTVSHHYDTVESPTTFTPMTLAQDGTRDTQTPIWEVGLVTGRTKPPGPDLLLRELERAAEKLEGDLQALEKERPEVCSHHHRRTYMLTQGGAWILSCLVIYLRESACTHLVHSPSLH